MKKTLRRCAPICLDDDRLKACEKVAHFLWNGGYFCMECMAYFREIAIMKIYPLVLGAIFLSSILFMAPVFAAQHAYEAPGIKKQRIQAVKAAQRGAMSRSIDILKRLHREHPNDLYVLADLIVLLRQAGRNTEIIQLTQSLKPDVMPAYAVLAWVGAERDEHRYARACEILKAHEHQLGPKGQVLYAMVTSEKGETKAAVKLLPPPTATGLDAMNLAQMAYVHRRAHDPVTALQLCTMALQRDPHNPLARQEQIYALSDLGADRLALDLAERNGTLIPPVQLDRLRANLAATHARRGLHERWRLEDQDRFKIRNLPLEKALAEIEQNVRSFPRGSKQQLRSRYDRVVVLRELYRMSEAVAAYEKLPTPKAKIPPYVRHAAADAYLALKQPKKAARLYRQLIRENPHISVQVYLALYYALVDGEQYGEALTLINKLHKITPIWRKPGPPRHGLIPNWERLDVDYAWALDPAYRNHEATAEQRARSLYRRAPRNTTLINLYARVLRWRGWPTRSQKFTEQAASYNPLEKDTRINLANNARDLEHFDRWGRIITTLKAEFPEDTTIDKSYAEWQDRERLSASSEYTFGRSYGGGGAVYGSRDREWKTRLDSPWTDSGWRAFIEHHYLWLSDDSGEENFDRLGVGVEWRWSRKHFWTVLSDDRLTGKDVGIAAGWSQWVNDRWRYYLSAYSYSTETPLRAHRAGYKGRAFHFGVNWRQSESRSAYAGIGLLDITDGNKRLSFTAGYTQRLLASAHHITSGGFDLYAGHNSQPGGPYFNPSDSQSAYLRLKHDWITWRHYERSFTQHFEIGIGMDWQAGYGGDGAVDLLYKHRWKLSRTWEVHYGVGWGTHVYDGNRERRLFGLIGFSGVF